MNLFVSMFIFATLALSALLFSTAPGVLVDARAKSNDARELHGLHQQRYLAHLLRGMSEVAERKRGRARQFGLNLTTVLREGLSLWKARLRDHDNRRWLNWIGGRKASHGSRNPQDVTHSLVVYFPPLKSDHALINYPWSDRKSERFKIAWKFIREKS